MLFASYLFLIIIKYNGHGAPDQKKALNNKAGRKLLMGHGDTQTHDSANIEFRRFPHILYII